MWRKKSRLSIVLCYGVIGVMRGTVDWIPWGLRRRSGRGRLPAFVLGALLGIVLAAAFATAARAATTITVNTTSDVAAAAGECAPTGSQCSLRQAIDAAATGDTVQLGGTAANPATYSVTLGQLTVAKSIEIVGNGVGATTIDGSANGPANGLSRIMKITAQASVAIQGITFTGGQDNNDEAFKGCSPCQTINGNGGGAIFSDATSTLSLVDVAFDGNSGGATPVGGGVASGGTLTMDNVSFTGNYGAFGGGLFVRGGTASGNAVTFRDNADYGGGGGVFVDGGTLTLTNGTFSGNGLASGRGGGLENHAGAVTLDSDSFAGDLRGSIQTDAGHGATTKVGNTIIGSGFSDGVDYGCVSSGQTDGFGEWPYYEYTAAPITTDLGHNLDQDGKCGLTSDGTGDVIGPDPYLDLAPIADNGGPVQTEALLAGSPAIDAGDDGACPKVDARGVARPQGTQCDIGAFEAVTNGDHPNATTDAATNVTATDALLSADISLSGEPGGYFFEWGPSAGQMTNQTPIQAAGVLSQMATVTQDLPDLSPGQTYYVRAVAANGTAQTVAENIQRFTTPAEAPAITNLGNSTPTDTSATITGTIDPQGADTTYTLAWGTDAKNLDQTTGSTLIRASAGPQGIEQDLTGLEPGTTYYYEIDATNAVGSTSSTPIDQQPAQFTTAAQVTGTEGQEFSADVLSGQDYCPDDGSFVTIDWGDGTSDSNGQVTCNSNTDEGEVTFTVSDAHTYRLAGRYTITADGGEDGFQTTYAQIADAPLKATPVNGTATTGSAFTGTVATFTDANPLAQAGDFTATIDWGDGTTPTSGTVAAAPGGGFQVSGSHTYTTGDGATITVTIADSTAKGVAYSTVQVTQPAPPTPETLSLSPVSTIAANAGKTFSGVVATFTDSNPAAVPSDFTATIDWGDGTPPTTGTVGVLTGHIRHAAGDPAFQVTGTHTYATGGAKTVAVSVANSGGQRGSVQSPMSVTAPPVGGSSPPTDVTPPQITGTTSAGSRLTATPGTWTGSPTSFTYRWLACAADGTGCSGTGATGSRYTMRARDVGHTLMVEVTAANAVGSSPAAPSATTAVVLPHGLPLPVAGHSADMGVVSGTVLIRLRGHRRFTRLRAFKRIPLGAVVDATHGRVTITVRGPGGKLISADFYSGKFVVSQPRGSRYTVLRLVGSLAACHAPRHTINAGVARRRPSRPKGHPVRHLWGSGHGAFQTVGKSASASVQGTIWLTADYCNGTLVRVRRGIILVRDFVHHKKVKITAGHSYFS